MTMMTITYFIFLGFVLGYVITKDIHYLLVSIATLILYTGADIKDDIKSTHVPCGSTDTNSVLVTPTK